ncbi:hypothetical protein CSAL01_09313 [Colletotrichum salicis]|uniref:Uncharacterized protein n=1 Tax=Colletotrichum salicis TaxID=1209931 RepID=A0A135U2V6_9PEZI|nr:hypothetical protein CSAL01_09313 [Colletotrichum salicis]
MDPSTINWEDAFWFFYWDLHEKNPPSFLIGEDGERKYDEFIIKFLKGQRLPRDTLSRPRSWNHLLWHLMRSTLYHTGLHLEECDMRNFSWLLEPPPENDKPLVNWMELLDIHNQEVDDNLRLRYSDERGLSNDYDGIFWVLHYLEERAFANIPCNPTMTEAWVSNPYLLQFEDFQGHQLNWAVSLPFKKVPTIKLGLPYLLEHDFVIVHEVDFDFDVIRLHSYKHQLGNRDLLSEAYFHYTTMLRWACCMMSEDRVSSIDDFLQTTSSYRHLSKQANAGDRLRITKGLWEAIRIISREGQQKASPA